MKWGSRPSFSMAESMLGTRKRYMINSSTLVLVLSCYRLFGFGLRNRTSPRWSFWAFWKFACSFRGRVSHRGSNKRERIELHNTTLASIVNYFVDKYITKLERILNLSILLIHWMTDLQPVLIVQKNGSNGNQEEKKQLRYTRKLDRTIPEIVPRQILPFL